MMLKFNPSKRATLDEIIQHPYFNGVRQPEREIIESQPIELYWDFDDDITVDDLRNVFRREISTQFENSEVIF